MTVSGLEEGEWAENLVRGIFIALDSLAVAARAIAAELARMLEPPVDVTEILDRLDELLDADAPDWREGRSRAALRRREEPRALRDQVLAGAGVTRVASGRVPRRGPGRSRALLGRAHPLNRTANVKGPQCPRVGIFRTC